jgi:hypothetical protein
MTSATVPYRTPLILKADRAILEFLRDEVHGGLLPRTREGVASRGPFS